MFAVLRDELSTVADYLEPEELFVCNIIAPHSIFDNDCNIDQVLKFLIETDWQAVYEILPSDNAAKVRKMQLALKYDCVWYIKTLKLDGIMMYAIEARSYRCIAALIPTVKNPQDCFTTVAKFGDQKICEIFGDIFDHKTMCVHALHHDNLPIVLFCGGFSREYIIQVARVKGSHKILAHFGP